MDSWIKLKANEIPNWVSKAAQNYGHTYEGKAVIVYGNTFKYKIDFVPSVGMKKARETIFYKKLRHS